MVTLAPEVRTARSRYLHGLDVARILAALAVIYAHYSNWLDLNGHDFPVDDVVNGLAARPLHVHERLSLFGVCVFLLISGMVVTHVAFKETSGQFLARRVVRLVPAMWVAVALGWVLVSNKVLTANRPPDLGDLPLNLALLNSFVPGASSVLAITWTLAVQLAFYLYVAATMPLLKRWPWLPPALSAALVSVLLAVVPANDGPPAQGFRMVVTFLPVLFLGQLVTLVRAGRLPAAAGVALGVVQYLLFLRADLASEVWPPIAEFPRQLVILLLLVLLATRLDNDFVRRPWVTAVAKRTYASYLLHIPVGFPVLRWLTPVTGYWVAIAVALVAVAAASELLYRFVENPIARWFRARERQKVAPST
ncbi:acyltransferase family protein [Actinosynnema sp. NPDC053489]|uniref:acyltransferase family protein n=1 Tax=Actinosynnema sp. NPDC053489 TaxID=3363916 RepID=UPI0037C5B859